MEDKDAKKVWRRVFKTKKEIIKEINKTLEEKRTTGLWNLRKYLEQEYGLEKEEDIREDEIPNQPFVTEEGFQFPFYYKAQGQITYKLKLDNIDDLDEFLERLKAFQGARSLKK